MAKANGRDGYGGPPSMGNATLEEINCIEIFSRNLGCWYHWQFGVVSGHMDLKRAFLIIAFKNSLKFK